ncbi:daunorubicin resistance protein DrrA family ABC transporter ATP-binding protein [Paraoerskovia sediminicola]|uniref:Daunorubicin resistance protein DrrA family ABC transporter ATP-binding protein n=1 Tax=Paraoerskovia sediminicola TaxID=1138587 RepID=A0ABN6XCS6_9CELL|nr:ATP-binding cassette domain-containing protein [Paraoerskovia sediminicola]BDZ42679.1 daunorubicin resistance protein DrrA family ABC transporter ATP-binding protein [Paraoerskovia sediminicola]
MPQSELAVEARGLVKHFKSRRSVTRAVDGIDLDVPRGAVYSVLGPNGAGKTTAVRMLATLLRPDAGTARVLGHDVVQDADAVRTCVGLTGQYASVDEDLTGLENLVMLARLYGFKGARARRRCLDLLGAFGLEDAGGRQVKTYSGGMRRRIDLAASLVMSPEVLFLDEPTTGLDPRSRNQVWDIVRVLVADGATVLLTTQYLEEADQLADRIAVIDHGKVIAEGTAADLKRSVGRGAVELRVADTARRAEAIGIVGRVLGADATAAADPYGLSARVPEGSEHSVAQLLPALADAGITVPEFSLGQPSLDEVFLTLTGHTPDDAEGAGASRGPTTAGDDRETDDRAEVA